MQTIILDHRHLELAYENQCLLIRHPEQATRSLPLKHVRKVICLHSVQLSTALLGQLWRRGIDFINLNNRYSQCSFGLYPKQQQQLQRRCWQYHWQQDEQACLALAQRLCLHRIRHTLSLLNHIEQPALVQQLISAQNNIGNSQDLAQLRGIEGSSQRLVFEYWRQLLPSSLGFLKRQRRPPKDPVNAVLSLTSTLILHEAIRQCTAFGLDPELGFYHRMVPGRASLACDLMETVRPYLEHWVIQLFLQKQLDKRHFTGLNNPNTACLLSKSGRAIFYPLFQANHHAWQAQLKLNARWVCWHLQQAEQQLGAH